MSQDAANQHVLDKIGLTGPDLRDMQAKHHAYVKSLNPAQKKSLAASTPTAQQAAATLGPDVTPEALEKFIRSHAPHDASTVLFNEGGDNG